MRSRVERSLRAGNGLRKLSMCCVLSCLTLGFVAEAAAQNPHAGHAHPHSDDKRDDKQTRHVHQKPTARSAAEVTDPRGQLDAMPQRTALLQRAEAELASGDAAAAIESFDRAALMLHAPDTEMGLVRGYMQAGEYRRALAFCAHTAGAHREAAAPGALYAWLLQAGGQNDFAQRTLAEALTRHPADKVLLQARAALTNAQPVTDALLLETPHRLAPHVVMQAGQAQPAATSRVLASGVLLASGTQALAPLSALPVSALQNSAPLWLRNGLGHTTQAVVAQRLEALGLAVLSLNAPLPIDQPHSLLTALQDPFGGSPGFVVAYSPSLTDQAAWPWLHAGFHGTATPRGERALGIDVPPSTHGGLVLDAAGRWAGVALTDAAGRALLVPVSALRVALPASDFSDAPAAAVGAPTTRMSGDLVYERALRFSLQVIAVSQ
jgi:tetratricopeptide (TPR) repeat protein